MNVHGLKHVVAGNDGTWGLLAYSPSLDTSLCPLAGESTTDHRIRNGQTWHGATEIGGDISEHLVKQQILLTKPKNSKCDMQLAFGLLKCVAACTMALAVLAGSADSTGIRPLAMSSVGEDGAKMTDHTHRCLIPQRHHHNLAASSWQRRL